MSDIAGAGDMNLFITCPNEECKYSCKHFWASCPKCHERLESEQWFRPMPCLICYGSILDEELKNFYKDESSGSHDDEWWNLQNLETPAPCPGQIQHEQDWRDYENAETADEAESDDDNNGDDEPALAASNDPHGDAVPALNVQQNMDLLRDILNPNVAQVAGQSNPANIALILAGFVDNYDPNASLQVIGDNVNALLDSLTIATAHLNLDRNDDNSESNNSVLGADVNSEEAVVSTGNNLNEGGDAGPPPEAGSSRQESSIAAGDIDLSDFEFEDDDYWWDDYGFEFATQGQNRFLSQGPS